MGPGAIDDPREFDPYTIPFFSHQYWFREGCWDVNITEGKFAARLAWRLFDADMPVEAIRHYLTLAELCKAPPRATEEVLVPIDGFVKAFEQHGTRNRDTLSRMREAVDGFRKLRGIGRDSWPLCFDPRKHRQDEKR